MDLSNKTNRVIFFFITLIGGMFGIHWFAQRNYKKGLLYLLTFGGFMFCWICDLFIALINIFSYKQERFSKQKMLDKKETKISSENNKQTVLSTEKEQSSNVAITKTITKRPKKNNESLQKTLFLYSLSFSASSLKNNNEYRRYLIYKYGIDNPQNFHKKMIDEGYFEPLSIENTLLKYKVDYLKDILKTFNLKPSGKKSDLINMVINFIPNDKLIEIVNKNPFYTLSSKGKKYLEDNYEYILIHNHSKWNINITEYNRVKSQLTNATFYDIANAIFHKRLLSSNIQDKRDIYSDMYQLNIEQDNKPTALYYLLLVIYFDFSGIEFQGLIELGINPIYDKDFHKGLKRRIRDKDGREKIVDVDEKNAFIGFKLPHSIINELTSLKEFYNESIVDDIYQNYKLPICCCPLKMFKRIINDILNNNIFDEEYYRPKLIASLQKIWKIQYK